MRRVESNITDSVIQADYVNSNNTYYLSAGDNTYEPEHIQVARKISSTSYKGEYDDALSLRTAGTGRWFIEDPTFVTWSQGGDERILFSPGMPGAGKSVMSAIVIEHLSKNFPDAITLYIYCKYTMQDSHHLSVFVGSLLRQLIMKGEPRSATGRKVYNIFRTGGNVHEPPSDTELTEALKAEAETYRCIFVIVDALDECRAGTRATLIRMLLSLPHNVRVMITSRPDNEYKGVFPANETVRLNIAARENDVAVFVKAEIQGGQLQDLVEENPELEHRIIRRVSTHVNGMFLEAQLILNALACEISPLRVEEALERLPTTTNEYYRNTLDRIRQQDRKSVDLAEKIFSWLTYQLQPLSLQQLQVALSIEPGMQDFVPAAASPEKVLLRVCAGLIVITSIDNDNVKGVSFVHYTVRKYFEEVGPRELPREDFKDFKDLSEAFESFLDKHCFLSYAAQNWGNHLRLATNPSNPAMLPSFLDSDEKTALAAQVMIRLLEPWKVPHATGMHPIHLLCFFGSGALVAAQLDGIQEETEPRDAFNRTPLFWAAMNNHLAVVKMLLKREGVDINCMDANSGGTPLRSAARWGHMEVVRALLDHKDVDVNCMDANGWTPLSWAVSEGHAEVVTALLDHKDVDINSVDNHGRTPLWWAKEKGYWRVVNSLRRACKRRREDSSPSSEKRRRMSSSESDSDI